jgi:hypothetical protein
VRIKSWIGSSCGVWWSSNKPGWTDCNSSVNRAVVISPDQNRFKETLTIYTDDKRQLLEAVSKSSERPLANRLEPYSQTRAVSLLAVMEFNMS